LRLLRALLGASLGEESQYSLIGNKNVKNLPSQYNLQYFSSENLVEMQCMLPLSQGSLVMGGHQSKLILFDIVQAMETRVVRI